MKKLKPITVGIRIKNGRKVKRQINRVAKALDRLADASCRGTAALTQLRDLLPVVIEAGEMDGVSNGTND